jgi:ornithine carbamoyltransferase
MTKKRDVLSLNRYAPEDIYQLLSVAAEFKAGRWSGAAKPLDGNSVALIFKKPSTRTRISFEAAVAQLGGHPIYLSAGDLQLGRGETIEDTGKVLSRYVQAIVFRTFEHAEIEALAKAADVPVINALTDDHHPCQALADLLTILEHKERLAGIKLVYVGDGNNVCHSLMIAAGKAGMDFVAACPPGYEPRAEIAARVKEEIGRRGGSVAISNDPAQAAAGADVLYTDVWASMGQDTEQEERRRAFSGWQLNAALVNRAKPDVIVMHCLPAHRGEEITAEVLEGPRSVVFDQAENRLHVQKALLVSLMGT